jgi:hypothetical protein
MSWRSLFAFDNPNGEVGRKFTATINASLAGTMLQDSIYASPQSIASFNTLPVGVYSVSLTIPIDNLELPGSSPSTTIFANWYIGPGASPTSNVTFPNYSVVPLYTTYTFPGSGTGSIAFLTTYVSANFIVSVTNSNPIYIVSNSQFNPSNSNFKFSTNQWNSNATCIATKLG